MFTTILSCHIHTRFPPGFSCRLPDFSFCSFHTRFLAGFFCRPPGFSIASPTRLVSYFSCSIRGSWLHFLLGYLIYIYYLPYTILGMLFHLPYTIFAAEISCLPPEFNFVNTLHGSRHVPCPYNVCGSIS